MKQICEQVFLLSFENTEQIIENSPLIQSDSRL